MAKNKKENAVVKSNKTANIIVGIVLGIAALIIVAVIVMCAVRVDPLDKIAVPQASAAQNDERIELFDLNSDKPLETNDAAQSRIRAALDVMDFSVMSAVLQWNWDYSYNFVRNSDKEKIEMTAGEVNEISATSTAYMVEFAYKSAAVKENGEIDYSTCQSLDVDGETVYFDRLKIVIDNSNGGVGEIYLYPYIYKRVTHIMEEGGVAYNTYRVTAVKVRANTTNAYAALGEIVTDLSRGTL